MLAVRCRCGRWRYLHSGSGPSGRPARTAAAPSLGQVGAVLAHDRRQGAQVPFAGHRRSYHKAPPTTLLLLHRTGHPQNVG